MLEKILTSIAKRANPERDVSVEKIGKHFFMHVRDSVGCNDYLLDGKYSYDEVVALNKLTGDHCGFGFCKELGPVAFIGVCNPHFCTTSGYFEYNVHEYGTTKDKDGFTGEEHPIQFAVVGEDQYVGIINLWEPENVLQFRDVWEYGCDEPKLQEIRFLSKEEAEKIDNFSLYVYVCPYSLTTKKYPIEKEDRTFDRRFKFRLPDGTDYRLV